jgi:ABC-type bacteriocin/lantibiotic exporter with double-glycine peptidase domain
MSAAPSATTEGRFGLSTALWRSPQLDGINCLYIDLKVCGYKGAYRDFLQHCSDAATSDDMDSLVLLAKSLGFDFRSVKLNRAAIREIRWPTVVFQEHEGIGHGSFSLYLGSTHQQAVLIEGTSMQWVQMPEELFERDWTGYACVPHGTSRRQLSLLHIVTVISVLTTASIELIYRNRTRLILNMHQ